MVTVMRIKHEVQIRTNGKTYKLPVSTIKSCPFFNVISNLELGEIHVPLEDGLGEFPAGVGQVDPVETHNLFDGRFFARHLLDLDLHLGHRLRLGQRLLGLGAQASLDHGKEQRVEKEQIEWKKNSLNGKRLNRKRTK